MSEGTTESTARPEAAAKRPRWSEYLTPKRIGLAAAVAVPLIAILVLTLQYRAARARRAYQSLMEQSLDRVVTAQEGFFYDSARYASSLRQLPGLRLPATVHAQIVSATPKTWWGVATHDNLPGRRCAVWVGTPPPVLPSSARTPDNETKPLCFDDSAARR